MKQLHFLIGVAPRSGTSYLADMICLHPDCSLPRDTPEDGLLLPADDLIRYAQRAVGFWGLWPDQATPPQSAVEGALGGGLCQLLLDRADSPTVLTKTPFPGHLSDFRRFFPDSRALVLLRDGRSVVESTRRSWGSPLDVAAARFRDGAREIMRALKQNQDNHLLVVRYEELLEQPQDSVRTVLDFLGLDQRTYPFDRITTLPLRGSSASGDTSGNLDWNPVDRPWDFAGAQRWQEWTPAEHRLFAAIAGPENAELGYSCEPAGTAAKALSQLLGVRRKLFAAAPEKLQQFVRRVRAGWRSPRTVS